MDRTKHDIDMMEHVFRGVSAAQPGEEPGSRVVSVTVGWQKWLSAVVSVEDADADDEPPGR